MPAGPPGPLPGPAWAPRCAEQIVQVTHQPCSSREDRMRLWKQAVERNFLSPPSLFWVQTPVGGCLRALESEAERAGPAWMPTAKLPSTPPVPEPQKSHVPVLLGPQPGHRGGGSAMCPSCVTATIKEAVSFEVRTHSSLEEPKGRGSPEPHTTCTPHFQPWRSWVWAWAQQGQPLGLAASENSCFLSPERNSLNTEVLGET